MSDKSAEISTGAEPPRRTFESAGSVEPSTTKPCFGDPGMTTDVSVLVPIKDEVDSIGQLVDEIRASLDPLQMDHAGRCRWEVVFVDDGSTDGSWDEVERLHASDRRVHGIRLRRNFGKSAALASGVAASSGRIIVTMDGDLQDDPAELPAMIARLDDPADLVAGHKADRKDPLGKRLPSKVFNAVTSVVTGLKLNDHNCGLKVGRREVFESLPLYGEMHRFFAAISHARGFEVVEHSVNHRPREHGSSKFGLERYARGGLDLLTVVTLTRYNRRPAHLFGGIGLIAGILGFAVLIYLTGVWLFTDQAIGNRPLLLLGTLLVLLAVQLTSLGVLAELIVTRDASREDPHRNVRQVTG